MLTVDASVVMHANNAGCCLTSKMIPIANNVVADL